MSQHRRFRILDVFNRYRFVGGEEKSVERIHASLSQSHVLEWCRFDSRDWVGKDSPGRLSRLNPADVLQPSQPGVRSIQRIVDEFQPDAALFHNIYPVGSPSLYHAASLRGLPVIQMVHNFRPFSVGGTLMADGVFTPESLGGDYWQEVRHGAWQGSVLKSALFASCSNGCTNPAGSTA